MIRIPHIVKMYLVINCSILSQIVFFYFISAISISIIALNPDNLHKVFYKFFKFLTHVS